MRLAYREPPAAGMGRAPTGRTGRQVAIVLRPRYRHCVQVDRATTTLALSVLLALIGCNRTEASQVRLVKVQHSPGGCHLTLNGVRIPDDVLVAKGKKERGKRAVASDGENEPDSCVSAAIMLRQAGMNIHEMPSIDLRS